MAETIELATAVERFPHLVLDTCVLIDALDPTPRADLRRIPRSQRRTSPITLFEFLHGVGGQPLAAATQAHRRKWLDRQDIRYSGPFHRHFADTLFSVVGRDGCPPALGDALIAADCLAWGWPLVTVNVRHFEGVQGLRIVDGAQLRVEPNPLDSGVPGPQN